MTLALCRLDEAIDYLSLIDLTFEFLGSYTNYGRFPILTSPMNVYWGSYSNKSIDILAQVVHEYLRLVHKW